MVVRMRLLQARFVFVQEGWKKVCGDDVGNLHFEYYPKPEDHGTYGAVL